MFRRATPFFLKLLAIGMFFAPGPAYATGFSRMRLGEMRNFLTENRYGLAKDFKQINSYVPVVDGNALSFYEGIVWRQREVMEMDSKLYSRILAPTASDEKRGLLTLALYCSYPTAGIPGIHRPPELLDQARELIGGSEGSEWTKKAHYIGSLGNLVKTIAVMNSEEEKDLYEFCDNEGFYRELLGNESRTLVEELRNETRITVPREDQRVLKKTKRRVKSILKPQPRRY
jgi:hypothetical protein